MKRRDVLATMGAATAAGSVLVGAGAYTRVEAQRGVTVEIVGDEDAYLGLRYGDLDVECGDVVTFVTITNQLKQPVSIDDVGFADVDGIELSDPWFVRCSDGTVFEEADELDVGQCVKVKVEILDCPVDPITVDVPFGVEVSEDDVLVIAQGSGDRSVEITCECPDIGGLSWVAFCGEVHADDIDFDYLFHDDDRIKGISWSIDHPSADELQRVVLWGGFGEYDEYDTGPVYLSFDVDSDGTSGEVIITEEDEERAGTSELASCPCDTEGAGVKFDLNDDGTIAAVEDGCGGSS